MFGSPIGKEVFIEFVHVARAAGQHGLRNPENPEIEVANQRLQCDE